MSSAIPIPAPLAAFIPSLRREGFLFAPAGATRAALESAGMQGWNEFARSWDDLGLDRYMADGGRYRRRRHATFSADAAGLRREPHQPHWQSRDYNALNGGIARWFDPVTDAVAEGRALPAILRACHALFDALTPSPSWHIEVHQFRIEARTGEAGQPTPEGMHRDGVDWVLVLMVGRVNVSSGETRIASPDRRSLGSFTLTEPMDAAWVDDLRVMHGVTPVTPRDPSQPAHRDVLVVTFRHQGGAGRG